MWVRNLLFVGLVGLGTTLYVVSLIPSYPTPDEQVSRAAATPDFGFSAVVRGVDAAFRNEWTDLDLQPAPRAPDLQIARRLSLSLTGTVPSLEEIRQLEAVDEQQRIDWWVSYLLADRRYSDYMAERLARAYVGVENGPFLVYRRRRFVSWLAEQLEAGRPYDSTVRQLISADGLWTNNPASNFLTVTIKPGNSRGPDESALAARVSRAFLGIRLDCAECHDHPFENWSQQQFQSLASFFGKADQTITGIRDRGGPPSIEDRTSGEIIEIEPAVPFAPQLLPEEGSPRGRLARWVTHPENQAFGRAVANRMWALMLGRALVEPVDNIPPSQPVPAALDLLADDFVRHNYDLRRLIRVIAATRVFQLDSSAALDIDGQPLPGHEITDEHELAWAVFPLTRLRSEQVVGGVLQAARLKTIDYDSHIVIKLARQIGQQEFVRRYGDAGEEELNQHGGTIPQRLLLLNGTLVKSQTEDNLVSNAATQIGKFAPNDAKAIETAYLSVLTRRPSPVETRHFSSRLRETTANQRSREMEDLYWSLINASEFSWNH